MKFSDETLLSVEFSYLVEENPSGKRWVAVSYPATRSDTKKLYKNFKAQHPDTEFRIIKITTIKSLLEV